MTDTVLNQGASDDGSGDTLQWNVDYDSTAHTIGTTITSTGTCTQAELIVTVPSLSQTYTLDCINGPAGDVRNQGRVVLAGPGSVLGLTKPVTSLPVPPFGRGIPPPYEIDFAWHQ
jgi:hypothetical protein